MPSSKTDIANLALFHIGESRVSNIETEAVERARVINQVYDHTRDALLQQYPWRFCLKRASLAPSAEPPPWGYRHGFPVPVDYLALREVMGEPQYTVEGREILTNSNAPLLIRYHSSITDESIFPPLFVEAFAFKLAHTVCERLTQSASKKDGLLQGFGYALNQAYTAEAIEGSSEYLPESDWLIARR